MPTKLTTTLLGAAMVLAALTGCSATSHHDAAKPTPSASSSASTNVATGTADAANTAPETTGKCVDGKAIITTADVKNGKAALGDCATVWVTVNNTHIPLGHVKKLAFEGTGNTVTYTGTTPHIIAGEKNTTTVTK
ncbi:DUF3060 domain-containing protein [Curtobacterium sp. MCLR17_054]|uniref:DUF3060 domain-containing protein n=1 Tax=Curtobacterium sp. MCLR17_054 TaxID=2175632 RepID=UPI000DA88C38|nr:DUF3060 domain-containing protein [Curtobacterium sp. MCLR17_054]WIE70299.1 DUF3060 domain-containing protein [Curtobacterium sp. MCLR17_054]